MKSNAMNKFTSQHYGEGSPLQRKLGETLDGGVHAIHMRVPYAESFVAHNPEINFIGPFETWDTSLLRSIDDSGYIDEMYGGAQAAENPSVNVAI